MWASLKKKKFTFLKDICFLSLFFPLYFPPSCSPPSSSPPPFLCLCIYLLCLRHQPQIPRWQGVYRCHILVLGVSDLDTRTKGPIGFQGSALGRLGRATLAIIIQLLSKIIMGRLYQLRNVWLPTETPANSGLQQGDTYPLLNMKSGGRWPRLGLVVQRGLWGPRACLCLHLAMCNDVLILTSVAFSRRGGWHRF